MFHKIKETFKSRASGKRQSEDGVPHLTRSEQLRPSHQGTRQSNMNCSNLPFLHFSRRQDNGDSRNRTSVQETSIPQTSQYAPSSPHHSPRHSQHSSSRSIQSNENGRPSTSTRAESVASRSSSHHTKSTNMSPKVVVPQGRSSRNELRPSSASRDEPRSSVPRSSITVEGPLIISSSNNHHTTSTMRHPDLSIAHLELLRESTGIDVTMSKADQDVKVVPCNSRNQIGLLNR
ncbi:uncharacterized protein EAE97_004660 [Botrytis byssoidea]|uniref:Uncharacterized protein n=1 Tax=Botrytis byssoidea TaxID=139641 RepID=A0A9P5M764_9HELO|nr:uncharacterized protein EAE97_004660 [Botrytis byssoidea]KAF7945622.1 hypothetical protein EAE97_004660 [Botrytis byssoidea]